MYGLRQCQVLEKLLWTLMQCETQEEPLPRPNSVPPLPAHVSQHVCTSATVANGVQDKRAHEVDAKGQKRKREEGWRPRESWEERQRGGRSGGASVERELGLLQLCQGQELRVKTEGRG